MDIDTYRLQVQESLSTRFGATAVERPLFSRIDQNRAILRVKLSFFDGSSLILREYVDTERSYPNHIEYEYQYVRDGETVFRYDNSTHHPEIETHPDHKHIGPDRNHQVAASKRPSYASLISDIQKELFRGQAA